MMDQWFYDFRSSLRAVRMSPVASIAAILLIAFGIGINSTVYSIADGFLRRPAAGVPENDRLVLVMHNTSGRSDPSTGYPSYLDYAAQSKTLQNLFAQGAAPERFTITLSSGATTDEMRGATVTPSYFETLRLPFAKGRAFSEEESNAASSGLPVVISYRLWQDSFSGAEDIPGRKITLNDQAAIIVGVAPAHFHGLTMSERLDIWVPLLSYLRLKGNEAELRNRKPDMGQFAVGIYGELRPGTSLSQAQTEMFSISKRLQIAYPESNKNTVAFLQTYSAGAGPSHNQEVMLFNVMKATVLMVLLIVCANVANLMLLRGIFRQRDYAVRQVLGAPRSRILRMLIMEGLILSCVALIPAYVFAKWASGAAIRLIPGDAGEVLSFGPDGRTLVYSVVLALASTLIFMTIPITRVFRRNLVDPLKAAAATGEVLGRSRIPLALVCTQLALSFALLTNFAQVRSFSSSVKGFIEGNGYSDVLVVDLSTQKSAKSPEQNKLLLNRLYDRFSSIPGVKLVSYSLNSPIDAAPLQPVKVDASQQPVRVMGNVVGPDYLRMLRVRGLAGRDISLNDREGVPQTVIINQNLAQTLWHGRPALGRTIMAGGNILEVVGIVPNGVLPGFDYHPEVNLMFLPERQNSFAPGGMAFYLQHTGDRAGLSDAVRAAVNETDPAVKILTMQTLARQVESITGPLVLISSLLFVFASGAFVIGGIGLFTVITYQVSARIREFGVRLALGSSPQRLINGQLRKGVKLALLGSAIGLVLSVAITRFLRHVVFGIGGINGVPAYVVVFTLLTIIAVLAYYLPARRTAQMNPMDALRDE
jgi:predicted permease